MLTRKRAYALACLRGYVLTCSRVYVLTCSRVQANNSAYLAEDIGLFDWDLSAHDVDQLDKGTDFPGSPCWACSE